MRQLLLKSLLVLGATVLLSTESLSPLHALTPAVLQGFWALATVAFSVFVWRHRPALHWEPLSVATASVIGVIAAVSMTTALLSPPNTYDALTYHLPRVVYWSQAGGIAFFPTHYLSQVSQPPLAEYFYLHTYLLSGGDHFVNLISTLAFLGATAGVTLIAVELGATRTAQAVTAIFCATLPTAILQATGPKNDLLLALWLVCLTYFLLRQELLYAGIALGLALATKGTAYLFAPFLILAALIWAATNRKPLPRAPLVLCLAAGALLLNAPQYLRNYNLTGGGSPLGADSPFAHSDLRWRNERLGIGPTFSNAIRVLATQAVGSSVAWNNGVHHVALSAHSLFALDPNDRATTWNGDRFIPSTKTRHEANAANPLHLAILFAAFCFALWRSRTGQATWLIYHLTLGAVFLAFCAYLRWQEYGARLLLPLYILSAPAAGAFLASSKPRLLLCLSVVLLLDQARLPLLENWIRPLRGPRNIFITTRESRYFADIPAGTANDFQQAIERVAETHCQEVGIDTSHNQIEYPLQALLRARIPDVRFQHVAVDNQTAQYANFTRPPCAVICVDCAGDASKQAPLSPNLSIPQPFGRLLLSTPVSIRSLQTHTPRVP